jgi:hypothetical protein
MRLTIIAVLLAVAAMPTSAGAEPDPYAQFRIPAHRWSSISFSAQGSGRTAATDVDATSSHVGNLLATLGGQATWGFDSDRLQHELRLDSEVSGGRAHSLESTQIPPSSIRDEVSTRFTDQLLATSLTSRVYPWQAPFGFQSLLSGTLLTLQSWANTSQLNRVDSFLTVSEITSTRHSVVHQLVGSLTLGFGRVRDATAVYAAQLMEQRLQSTGALTRPLTQATREKVAALFAVEGRLGFAHDRPDKYFWRELERILREDGALQGSLDAWSVLRLMEPVLPRLSWARPAGFFVGPNVSAQTVRRHEWEDLNLTGALLENDSLVASIGNATHAHNDRRDDHIFVGASAELHRPLGMRWQTDASTLVSYARSGHVLQVQSALSAAWLVADRWSWNASLQEFSETRNAGEDHPRWQVAFESRIAYYLEDALDLSLSWATLQARDEPFGGPRFDRRDQYQLGVRYRFRGTFEAPGIMPAQYLSPPR